MTVSGINYPWTVFAGRPNYGCDFGRNQWDCHAGVTTHLDEVRDDFRIMAAEGFKVARWFVFADMTACMVIPLSHAGSLPAMASICGSLWNYTIRQSGI